MNFIYTIFIFAISATLLFVTGMNANLPGEDTESVLIGFGIVGYVVTFITTLVMFFSNQYNKGLIKEQFNQIREYKSDKKTFEVQLAKYKTELEESLTKMYPNYEKELFSEMNPKDAEQINAFMLKYPELQFSGVLEQFTGQVTSILQEISKHDRYLNDCVRRIRNNMDSDWFFLKVRIPKFVQTLMDADDEE